MKAINKLQNFKVRFDEILQEEILEWKKEAAKLDERWELFMKVLEEFVVRGGKRIRPAFLYYSYLACGGKEKERAMRAGVSLELLHAFLLIHDDLIDNSDLRRGGPTVHRVFEKEHEKLGLEGSGEEFGRSTAMILGDVVQMLARKQLRKVGLEKDMYRESERMMEDLLWETAYGWYIEMLNTKTRVIEEEEIKRSMEYVSARYTVSGPVKMGAMLAGAQVKQIKALEEYGLSLGLAFQIQDDVLGMFGDEAKVGKPAESDLKEGKKTLLILRVLEKLEDRKVREKLMSIYGNNQAKKEDLVWVRELIKNKGVLDEVKEEARDLAEKAKGELEGLGWGEDGEEFLLGIASYIVEREI